MLRDERRALVLVLVKRKDIFLHQHSYRRVPSFICLQSAGSLVPDSLIAQVCGDARRGESRSQWSCALRMRIQWLVVEKLPLSAALESCFTPFEKPGASRGVRAPGLPPVLGIGIGELEMKAKLGPRPDSSRCPKATISILWQGFKPRLPRSRGWTCQASYGRASFAPMSEFLRRVVQEDVC